MNPGKHLNFSIVDMMGARNSVFNSVKSSVSNYAWDSVQDSIRNFYNDKISVRNSIENERDVIYYDAW